MHGVFFYEADSIHFLRFANALYSIIEIAVFAQHSREKGKINWENKGNNILSMLSAAKEEDVDFIFHNFFPSVLSTF